MYRFVDLGHFESQLVCRTSAMSNFTKSSGNINRRIRHTNAKRLHAQCHHSCCTEPRRIQTGSSCQQGWLDSPSALLALSRVVKEVSARVWTLLINLTWHTPGSDVGGGLPCELEFTPVRPTVRKRTTIEQLCPNVTQLVTHPSPQNQPLNNPPHSPLKPLTVHTINHFPMTSTAQKSQSIPK